MAFVRDTNCLTPIMTSSVSPSGTVIPSPEGIVNCEAYRVFTGNVSDYYYMRSDVFSAARIVYDFKRTVTVNYYNIYCGYNVEKTAPTGWWLRGFNTDTQRWEYIDTREDQKNWETNVKKTCVLDGAKTYTKYELVIGYTMDGQQLSISELELCYGTPPSSQSTPPQAYAGGI